MPAWAVLYTGKLPFSAKITTDLAIPVMSSISGMATIIYIFWRPTTFVYILEFGILISYIF